MTSDSQILDDKALDTLFRAAHTHTVWQARDVSDVLLHAVYDLAKMGPTSANTCPARFVFVRSKEAKEKLKPHLDPGNVDKTMSAPVTAIIAHDMKFYDKLPHLYPQADARSWFAGKPDFIQTTAFRNGSLQGAYLIIAARALGLDCGPMSGFNNKGVQETFFPGEDVTVNFLCNIGYGDPKEVRPRNPRLPFDEACRIV